MLISTKPDTPGKEAVLSRSRQLTEFTRPIPRDGANFKVYFENKYGI